MINYHAESALRTTGHGGAAQREEQQRACGLPTDLGYYLSRLPERRAALLELAAYRQ